MPEARSASCSASAVLGASVSLREVDGRRHDILVLDEVSRDTAA